MSADAGGLRRHPGPGVATEGDDDSHVLIVTSKKTAAIGVPPHHRVRAGGVAGRLVQ
jgi:hypothetical protein